jgi:hypothetical protein
MSFKIDLAVRADGALVLEDSRKLQGTRTLVDSQWQAAVASSRSKGRTEWEKPDNHSKRQGETNNIPFVVASHVVDSFRWSFNTSTNLFNSFYPSSCYIWIRREPSPVPRLIWITLNNIPRSHAWISR